MSVRGTNDMAEQAPIKIKAEPTKELFVHVLTRDIPLYAAITELVDNAVDGAKRIAADKSKLTDFLVEISFDGDEFCISDNCGGIPLDVARDYAFRFGRAADAKGVPGSIGQFGVGMKRALFSFGRSYVVHSITKETWFKLTVDLDLWMSHHEWDFDLTEYGKTTADMKIGTQIVVSKLNQDAARQFVLPSFKNRVENEIKQKHRFFISNGLVVKVGGVTIPKEEWQLFEDAGFKPEFRQKTYNGAGKVPVTARIYAGVSRSSPSDAGWNVICNGRLVLNAEKTEKTGWGWESGDVESETSDSPGGIPRYHNQFARFRGYVLFDSDDASRLPWNTTKTDIDPDDPIWLDTRDELAIAMRPVIDFLNIVDSEAQLPQSERSLTAALMSATTKSIGEVRTEQKFSFPTGLRKPGPKMTTIQFRKESDRVAALQDAMGTNSARETGDAAFEEAYGRHVEGK